ncbi:type 2 periplasmic-binding domain-containing protein [Paraburkholderia sp. RL17-337-BIB-A]|uniref:hypothetical protein n=1 Tax=Paraburkholderia sp. RL17-337-BIB-A TaxID=3031636 RepID=UPI0038B7F525
MTPLCFVNRAGVCDAWSVRDGASVREVSLPPVLVPADGQALVDAALAGFGITQIHDGVALPHARSAGWSICCRKRM